jgi:adenosine kinase
MTPPRRAPRSRTAKTRSRSKPARRGPARATPKATAARPARGALVCGSLAFDTIMVFGDRFGSHILPDKIHMLNVAFLVPEMRREFGGCAGNICYNLKLLGDAGYPMATVGRDFGPYADWLRANAIPDRHVRVIASEHTAQAFITTDLDDNQMTAFHPGAMQHSHLNRVDDAGGVALGIVAPDGRAGMIQHAAQFHAAGIPFMFDPGQGLPMFGAEELETFVEQATWVAVNDYEWQLMQNRTGLSVADVVARADALIVTHGAQGSVIHTERGATQIPCAPASRVVDPTGCGDAYRAGLIHGLLLGLDWPETGRIAALLAAIKIESRGTQNHRLSAAGFARRYRQAFGADLPRASGPKPALRARTR